MNYLLDTNICIYIIKKAPESVLKKLEQVNRSKHEVFLSSITVAELQYGVKKSSKPIENGEALKDFLSLFKVLDFDLKGAEYFGIIRAELERTGKIIGPYDLQIASIAIAHDLIVVTNNTREFERVSALKLVNWV